ncbi:hypothetical protein H4I96_07112 [Botrytis cinerea]
MPTDEGYPMITAPVPLHDLDRALKRDSITCNNDICNSPAICAGPISNYVACCYPGEACDVVTTCYPYTENQTYLESVGASYCPGSPTITQYVTIASSMGSLASQTETAPSTSTSTASLTPMSTSTSTDAILAITTSSSAVATTHHALPTGIAIGIAVGATLLVVSLFTIALLLWRRRLSSSTTNIPQPPSNSNPEIQVASYVSPNPDSNPHTSWISTARGCEKSPSYAFEARRMGNKPEFQVDGLVDEINERSACAPPAAEMVASVEPVVISELGVRVGGR